MEIILALDIGDRKTGIAKSDLGGIMPSPVKTVETADLAKFLEEFQKTYSIQKLIIGLPKNMDGSEGPQAEKVRSIAQNLNSQFPNLDIYYEDERLSSEAALELLRSEGKQIRENNKYLVDQYAALIILKQFLGLL